MERFDLDLYSCHIWETKILRKPLKDVLMLSSLNNNQWENSDILTICNGSKNEEPEKTDANVNTCMYVILSWYFLFGFINCLLDNVPACYRSKSYNVHTICLLVTKVNLTMCIQCACLLPK